jgi:hypothetical protein
MPLAHQLETEPRQPHEKKAYGLTIAASRSRRSAVSQSSAKLR